MRLRRLLILCFALAVTGSLAAQDNVYTLHDYAPLWQNPANTGAFAGSVRVGGVYRGQWYSINGIQSPTGYVDAPLAFGLRKQDWIGVGLSLVNNKQNFEGMVPEGSQSPAGSADVIENFFGFSLAYHLSLDKKRTNILTLGAQYGSITYSGDFSGQLIQEGNIANAPGFITPQFNEFMATPDMGGGNNMGGGGRENSVNDINAGVKLKLLLDEKKENVFEAGVSVLHLTSPERRAIYMSEDDVPIDSMGMNPTPRPVANRDLLRKKRSIFAHARLDMEMSEKWRFQPTAMLLTAQGSTTLSTQLWGQLALKQDMDLRVGLGYRTGDAAQVLFGLNFGQIKTAISYDITLSQARAVTNYQGAFEIGAMYIFNIYKKPEVTPTLLCPDI